MEALPTFVATQRFPNHRVAAILQRTVVSSDIMKAGTWRDLAIVRRHPS